MELKLFKYKIISRISFVFMPVIIVASCGGSGGGDSGPNGISNNPSDSTPVTSGAPGTSGLVSWPFVNLSDYTYDISKIQVADDVVSLILVDQTDDGNTSMGFGGAAHNNTVWDSINDRLALSPGASPYDASGDFTSRIIDAGAPTSWSALSWTPQGPHNKELPNNAQTETGYSEGNADMSGNVLLFHMNEISWNGTASEVVDSSGSGNHGTAYNGVTATTSGKFNGAGNFNGVSGYIKVLDSNSLDITGPMTISAWIYPRSAGGSTQGGIVSKSGGGASGGYKFSIDEGNCYPRSLMFNWSCSNPDVITYNQWQHVAVVYDGSNSFFYVNAASAGTDQPYPRAANALDIAIGSWQSNGAYKLFDGYIDEVAIYNRALTAQEIIDSYKRGAVRMKFQVRSCDGPSCDNDQFAGPDGTAVTFFSELDNLTTGLPSFTLNNLPDNRYFQYKAYLETDDISYSPELKNVIIGPAHYPGDNPTIVNNTGQPYSFLNSFTERSGNNSEGEVRYQISNDGTNWYYHNGTNWESAADYPETNSADEVNIYLWAFPAQIGAGTFYFKAFLHSDTAQQLELDRIYLSYTN